MTMAAKKKVVLLLDLHEYDDSEKRKVLKAASVFPGLDMISIDMKERKLTLVGLVDPIEVVTKLRRLWHADILFVGPASDDGGGGKKLDGGCGGGGVKREGDKQQHQQEVMTATQVRTGFPPRYPYPYQPQAQPRPRPPHGRHENDDPNGCVIC